MKQSRIEKFNAIDIYPVISHEFCGGRDPLDVLKAVADGGAKIVQLREKELTKEQIFKMAVKYRDITDKYDMLLIINDHTDVALAVNADGIHLGQDDLPVKAASTIAPELIIGCSTHSKDEAVTAQEEGASYINIGPVFQTQTKQLAYPALGIEILKEIPEKIQIPFTVMGGIKEKHIPELIAAGAKKIAMVTEITKAEDITTKVIELRKYFK